MCANACAYGGVHYFHGCLEWLPSSDHSILQAYASSLAGFTGSEVIASNVIPPRLGRIKRFLGWKRKCSFTMINISIKT